MKRKDDLFQLIKTLSKSEKRFFKIYSGRHVIGAQNNYVELFDAISKQNEYNEEALIRKFSGKKLVNRFSVAKSYLYDLILKSMNTYHAQNTVDAQILDLLRNISFLFEKNLYEQADRIIQKAKKLALEYEKISILPEIMIWEKKLMEASFYANKNLDDIIATYKEARSFMETALNVNEYWVLDAQLYYQSNLKGIVRNRSDLKKVESVFSSPLLKSEEEELSYESRILLYKIHSTYFFILRDLESCYKYISKLVNLQESRQELIRYRPMLYVTSLNNLLNITGALGKKDETEEKLATLKGLMSDTIFNSSSHLQLKMFESYYYHTLNYCRNQRQFERGMLQIQKIEEGLEEFGDRVDSMGRLMLCFYSFHICYEARNFEEALRWLAKIRKQEELSNIRQDIFFFSRIFYLMMHYELDKMEQLSPLIKKTYAYLIKRESQYQFETVLASFLKDLTAVTENEQFKNRLLKLREELSVLAEDPFERKAFAYFDFMEWIDRIVEEKGLSSTAVSSSEIMH